MGEYYDLELFSALLQMFPQVSPAASINNPVRSEGETENRGWASDGKELLLPPKRMMKLRAFEPALLFVRIVLLISVLLIAVSIQLKISQPFLDKSPD